MARDTFAREDYVVGTYATRELAEAAAREREARHGQHQDEGVRDELWVVPDDGDAR